MWVRSFLLLGFLCSSLFGRETNSLSQVQREITAHLSQKKFAEAMWGIKVVALDPGKTLFETNAQKLLKPASNAKVFTAALALDALGSDYRIRTSLLAKERANPEGVLRGDLIVYGRGDPSFSARFQDGNNNYVLRRVVEAVRATGVKRIEGDLMGDETFFSGPRFGASWTWDDLQYAFGAEVSALSVQDNVVDLSIRPGAKIGDTCVVATSGGMLEFVNRTRTSATNVSAAITVYRPLGDRRVYVNGTLPRNHGVHGDAATMPNPAWWFVTLLREALEREGISVSGKLRVRSWPEDERLDLGELKEIGFTESPPLREIVPKMLKPSQNLYAQLLLLQVGVRSNHPGRTEDAGVRELRAFVKRAGLDPNEVLLDEGAGLSRTALVTPHALAGLHQHMARHAHAELFREALPAPGEGTLRNRLTDLKGVKLRAKTGTIRYVSTLSGYMENQPGQRIAFAIMLNGYDGSTSPRDEVEAVVRLLAKLKL